MTKNICIVYHSGHGHTEKLALCISEGCKNHACHVELFNIMNFGKDDLNRMHGADAIIFGSPTYMGGLSGPFKVFMDKTSDFWLEQKWKDKIASGFTVSNSPSGDKANTLVQMAIFAAQHSMIWVSVGLVGSDYTSDGRGLNSSGCWLGLGATASRDKSELITAQDAESARIFGNRVSEAVIRW